MYKCHLNKAWSQLAWVITLIYTALEQLRRIEIEKSQWNVIQLYSNELIIKDNRGKLITIYLHDGANFLFKVQITTTFIQSHLEIKKYNQDGIFSCFLEIYTIFQIQTPKCCAGKVFGR